MVLKKIALKVDALLTRYLDSEEVMLFQVVVYLHMALAGIYGLFIARGIPPALQAAAEGSAGVEAAWLVLLTLGLLTLIGRVMVASRFAKNKASVYTFGAWMQFTGDLAMMWGFFWYVVASWGTAYWGKESIAAFGFFALSWCAFFLVVRDIRRIMQAERAVRQ